MNNNIIDRVKMKITISNFEKMEVEKAMDNKKILKTVASLILAVGMTCGVAYAGHQLTNYFRIKGIDDTGIQTALENQYVQNIEMDYIEKEKVKFKVDYLMMDDINFDLVFNFVTEDEVKNYEAIAITNLKVTDENNNQIYIDSEDQNIWTKNIALSSELWTVIEKQDHTLRQVLHLSSNNFPKSNKIYINFEAIILYNVNKGKPITIKYEDNYELEFDVSKQLINREVIEYNTANKDIEEAKLTNSGFAVTINTKWLKSGSDKFILKDLEGNNYTLSNKLYIFTTKNLDKAERVVLIFNMTKYNKSDSITLTTADGKIVEFTKNT